MKSKRSCSLLMALLVICGLLLSACTGQGTTDPTGTSDQSQPTQTQPQDTQPTDTQPPETTESPFADVNELEPNENGVYQIHSAAGVANIAAHPEGSFELLCDVDMAGQQWTPVESFTGSLDGKGYAISNLTISAAAGENMGFFGSIESGASVKDLYLMDVTVEASQTQAVNLGVLAGTVSGTVTNCTTMGKISDDRTDEGICAGGIAGLAADGASISGGSDLTLIFSDTGSQEPVEVESKISADVKLFVQTANKGLVGKREDSASVSGLWRDYSNSSELASQTIQERQQKIVDYMYKMGSVVWTVSEDLIYQSKDGNSDQSYLVGKTYSGLPYCSMHGSYERFMSCLDENNQTLAVGDPNWTLAKYNYSAAGDLLGYNGYVRMMGNDCSGAVYWAWLQVSPSDVKSSNGIRMDVCQYMIPIAENQENTGIRPVGDYDTSVGGSSENIFNANGMPTMFNAYALARKGDAMVTWLDAGHTRLCATDAVVVRNVKGEIDGDQSFFLMHEQGALTNLISASSTWRVNTRFSFRDLMYGGIGYGSRYLPVTMRALQEGYEIPAPTAEAVNVMGPANGQIRSNYRINSTTVTVKGSDGTVVYDETVYAGVGSGPYRFLNDSRSGNEYHQIVNLADDHSAVMETLSSGEYTFTITVTVSNGDQITVVQDQPYSR